MRPSSLGRDQHLFVKAWLQPSGWKWSLQFLDSPVFQGPGKQAEQLYLRGRGQMLAGTGGTWSWEQRGRESWLVRAEGERRRLLMSSL